MIAVARLLVFIGPSLICCLLWDVLKSVKRAYPPRDPDRACAR